MELRTLALRKRNQLCLERDAKKAFIMSSQALVRGLYASEI